MSKDYNNDSKYVTEYLVKNNLTISFMESCTSGLLASMFTDTEGASNVFAGSLVTYANKTKIEEGVDSHVIDTYGVYSSECAKAMAKAVRVRFNTDIAVGITGTTGNVDPNNSDSIEGEAYFCIIFNDMIKECHIKKDVGNMSRKDIKQYYADEVYRELKELILS